MSVLSLLPEDKRKDFKKESLESVYSSNSRLNLLYKRKRLAPLADMSQASARSKSGDRYVTQRVLSAKTHRVKNLQNQLADAHYHLQELSNENRVLRAIQKKHEIALQRYENSNAELPQVLNSHSEEMRVQQSMCKQLKAQLKETTQKLKERDVQLQVLRDEHAHLTELSRDKNLQEREKLQAQNENLVLKVQQQNETITMLHRRLTLEAKNFKHQLQTEINRHKDTRADLDLAINNADKLSTIIEMKEKLISTAASRPVRSPPKMPPPARPLSKSKSSHDTSGRSSEERHNADQNLIAKMCESSRNLNSVLSSDEHTSSSLESRSRYATRSRTSSTSTRSTPIRKTSKGSDDIIELAKTVQEGMADLAIYDNTPQLIYDAATQNEVQKKMEVMKADLMHKIRQPDDEKPKSALRRISTEGSIEEQVIESDEIERPKSRGRRNSSVSFYANINTEEITTVVASNGKNDEIPVYPKPHRENNIVTKLQKENSVTNMAERRHSITERKLSGKPIDKYCKDIIHDIEKSSKVIDKHVKQFQNSRFENDHVVQQLQAIDKMNEMVSGKIDIPSEALAEMNNNFKMLADQVFSDVPETRKRSISGRRSSKDSRPNLMGDVGMSNQDLLDDLLGKK